MRGSIQKKGNTYYAVIPLNGKRKWFKGGPAKKDAERVLNDHIGEVQSGSYKELPRMTFGQFAEKWLNDYADVFCKPSTRGNFTDVIGRLLLPEFKDSQISDVSTRELQSFVSGKSKVLMPNTVRNYVTVIRLLFKYAKKWGYIRNNPAIELERPKIDKPEIEILSPEEFELFISKAEKPYRTAFLTAFIAGTRAGELWGLKWGDIDWNSKQIHVRRALWKDQFQKPKTKTAIRKIDMTERLVRELKEWKLASPINEHDVVFPSPEGKLTQHDNVIKRYFNPALRRAGLRHISFHSLRHSNASLRIRAGQNIKYIQGQLGHASINMTMDVYGHLFEDQEFNRKQVELLESVRNPLEKHSEVQYATM